jgi:hypothetical protein
MEVSGGQGEYTEFIPPSKTSPLQKLHFPPSPLTPKRKGESPDVHWLKT